MKIICPRCQGTKKSACDDGAFGTIIPPCDFCAGEGSVERDKAYPEHLSLLAEAIASQIVDEIVQEVHETDGKVEDSVEMGAHVKLIAGVKNQLATLNEALFYAIYNQYFSSAPVSNERTIVLPNPLPQPVINQHYGMWGSF